MGAPFGNKNGTKVQRLWADMLRRKVAQDPEQLERIAITVLKAAEEGEPWAVTEVANRLDGKPVQQLDLGGDPAFAGSLRDMSTAALLELLHRHGAETPPLNMKPN